MIFGVQQIGSCPIGTGCQLNAVQTLIQYYRRRQHLVTGLGFVDTVDLIPRNFLMADGGFYQREEVSFPITTGRIDMYATVKGTGAPLGMVVQREAIDITMTSTVKGSGDVNPEMIITTSGWTPEGLPCEGRGEGGWIPVRGCNG